MSDSIITTEYVDRTAIVTLRRSERANALSMSFVTAITETFLLLHRDRSCDAVILQGAGKHFCSGADIKELSDPAPDTEARGPVGSIYRSQEHLAKMILAIHECDKPVIAAIHGAAVGGGLAIALACDLRVATPDATFGAVFPRLGLSACDVGVSYFLPRLIGPTRAAELMLTARHFSGTEAAAFGMLNRICEQEQLLEEAMGLASAIGRMSEYGVWMTKHGVWHGMDATSLRAAIELENRTQVLGTFTGNFVEGAIAFQEGRDPNWNPM